jgi:hypothetical protein
MNYIIKKFPYISLPIINIFKNLIVAKLNSILN